MHPVGFVVMTAGIVAAPGKLGALSHIGAAWTLIGVVIAIGFGILFSISSSGAKESIEIGRK